VFQAAKQPNRGWLKDMRSKDINTKRRGIFKNAAISTGEKVLSRTGIKDI